MKLSLRKSLFAIALFSFVGAFAQGPNNSGTYYSAADGKKGKALKTALSKIIGNPKVTSYNRTYFGLSEDRPSRRRQGVGYVLLHNQLQLQRQWWQFQEGGRRIQPRTLFPKELVRW